MRQRWTPEDGYFGLERAPLAVVAACITAMTVAIVFAVVTDASWLQLVFVLAFYGALRWWRAAVAYRATAG